MKLLWSTLLVCVAALAVSGAGAATTTTTTYSITDLGSLGYGVTRGLAINNNGQITGYSYSSTEFQVTCPPRQYGQQKKCFEHEDHAFLWSGGTMTDLGTLGGHFSQGNAINLSGQVIGSATLKTGFTDSALWSGGKVTDLGSAAPDSGINDLGELSGTCGSYACVDNKGKVTQLPNPSNVTGCNGGQINSSGEVIGSCDDASSFEHAVLWQNGTPTDLGTFGGPQAFAYAISDLGHVVGFAQTSTDADHGFLWINGKMTDLGLNFFPAAINDNDVIVGGNEIYSGGTVQNLQNLIPAGAPYQIDYANGINDKGQIVADAYDTATNQGHAILLTPN